MEETPKNADAAPKTISPKVREQVDNTEGASKPVSPKASEQLPTRLEQLYEMGKRTQSARKQRSQHPDAECTFLPKTGRSPKAEVGNISRLYKRVSFMQQFWRRSVSRFNLRRRLF